MTKLDPIVIAQRLANNLTPTHLREAWFHLTGVLCLAYQVEAEPLIECVRPLCSTTEDTAGVILFRRVHPARLKLAR